MCITVCFRVERSKNLNRPGIRGYFIKLTTQWQSVKVRWKEAGKSKGKVYPRTGHEGPEGEKMKLLKSAGIIVEDFKREVIIIIIGGGGNKQLFPSIL
jgi:hypothetical protein